MSTEEQITATTANEAVVTEAIVDQERAEKILKAKELYNHGSRNFLVKSYAEAADELSQVCALYEELYGELSDELGMPYLLYAKSLIALALDENKVIDVPDEQNDGDDDEEDDDDGNDEGDELTGDTEGATVSTATKSEANGQSAVATSSNSANGGDKIAKKAATNKADEADSTADTENGEKAKAAESEGQNTEEAQVSSTDEGGADVKSAKNGDKIDVKTATPAEAIDNEKPSTSNAENADLEEVEEEENEAASSLQLAWEILELAAKIFSRQGISGLPNLAEVHTELANIEFENSILDTAREDYEKALKIYQDLPTNYRRAMAEIHYKIGLTYLMEQLNKAGAGSLKEACNLIDDEIGEIKAKAELSEKDKNNIQDLEETKQEIWDKIAEIEETPEAPTISEVRAALDNYIKPLIAEHTAEGSGPSSSSADKNAAGATSSSAITSSSKPTDISHLIKRKKPDEPNSEADASPAKRPAV